MTAPALDPLVEFIRSTRMSEVFRDQVAWLWPLCESLHFLGLILLIGAAGFFDLRLLGFFNRVPISACKEFMPWAMVGFALNLVSGTVFLIIFPGQYVYSQTWWFKVFFLLIAGANALVFETKMADRLLALQPGEASTGADPLAESNDPNDSNDPNVFL